MVIFGWAEPSSRGVTTYETLLHDTGDLTCDCPGWIIKRKNQDRACTHTKKRHADSLPLMELFRAGQPLPTPKRQLRSFQFEAAATPVATISRIILDEEDE